MPPAQDEELTRGRDAYIHEASRRTPMLFLDKDAWECICRVAPELSRSRGDIRQAFDEFLGSLGMKMDFVFVGKANTKFLWSSTNPPLWRPLLLDGGRLKFKSGSQRTLLADVELLNGALSRITSGKMLASSLTTIEKKIEFLSEVQNPSGGEDRMFFKDLMPVVRMLEIVVSIVGKDSPINKLYVYEMKADGERKVLLYKAGEEFQRRASKGHKRKGYHGKEGGDNKTRSAMDGAVFEVIDHDCANDHSSTLTPYLLPVVPSFEPPKPY